MLPQLGHAPAFQLTWYILAGARPGLPHLAQRRLGAAAAAPPWPRPLQPAPWMQAAPAPAKLEAVAAPPPSPWVAAKPVPASLAESPWQVAARAAAAAAAAPPSAVLFGGAVLTELPPAPWQGPRRAM